MKLETKNIAATRSLRAAGVAHRGRKVFRTACKPQYNVVGKTRRSLKYGSIPCGFCHFSQNESKSFKVMTVNKPIKVTYSDERLRTLVEEFITMQKHEFTFRSLCSYILFWAKEEDNTIYDGLYESNELAAADCERISEILRGIIREGRISCGEDSFADDTHFMNNKD